MMYFADLVKASVWRMKNAQTRPVSVLLASSHSPRPVYLHKITFLGDGRWCFANAYAKHEVSK